MEIEQVRRVFEVLNVERVGRKDTRVIERNGGEARAGPGATGLGGGLGFLWPRKRRERAEAPHHMTNLSGAPGRVLGIFISILSAVTVVFSTQKPFIIYSMVYIVILTGLSASKPGRDWVFVDVGLCTQWG